MSATIILIETIIPDRIMSPDSGCFTATHFNMVGYPRTFKSNMQVPGDGKEGVKKNKNKALILKTWREFTNPDTIEL